MSTSEKLHPFHVAILVYMVQSGVVIFVVPRVLAETFGTFGWLMLPCYLAVTGVNIWLISLVYRLNSGEGVFEMIDRITPKAIRYPVYVILSAFWAVLATLVAKKYVLVTQIMTFTTTPPYFILGTVLVVSVLIALNGIYNVVKTATVFFGLSMWLILLGLFFIGEIELKRYTAFLFKEGTWDFSGMVDIYVSFLGYEIALFLFPYINKGKSFFLGCFLWFSVHNSDLYVCLYSFVWLFQL
ncbi:GerAB/ArcD/ProY family transporter [Evansella halocellulosilytica]|uniref:GerAB/ArcD/ProY family transporter n=1 Tax=Evansella halocellulosilytica TaxID=2011013 RepID=UPI000BB9660C|nr:GerAB/ArcD/ProY family transporter [Evansella halocellulosilytica]